MQEIKDGLQSNYTVADIKIQLQNKVKEAIHLDGFFCYC